MIEPYKISVIIPIFKTEAYLSRCLDSILNNTYRNLEIICINDGSPDDSGKILEKYQIRDSRIVVLSQENRGISAARNAGIDIATGEFIAFIDSDDWIHPNYFRYLAQLQQETKVDIAICGYKRVDSEEPFNELPDDLDESLIKTVSVSEIINMTYSKTFVWGRMYSKRLIADSRFDENVALEDTCFNFEVIFRMSGKIKYGIINIPLYFYYVRQTSVVHSLTASMVQTQIVWYLKQIKCSRNRLTQEMASVEALKSFLAFRYLYLFDVNVTRNIYANGIKSLRKSLYTARKVLWKCRNIPVKKKIQYEILYQCPFVYRIFRIIDDPTMLDWEKHQRKERRARYNNVKERKIEKNSIYDS